MLESVRHAPMISAIPVDRILTEPDDPFTNTAGRPSKPVDVKLALEALGTHGVLTIELAAHVRQNLRNLLKRCARNASGHILGEQVERVQGQISVYIRDKNKNFRPFGTGSEAVETIVETRSNSSGWGE